MASTIANLALLDKAGHDPADPVFLHVMTLDLKDDYNGAGLVNFKTMVKAALGVGRTVLGVIPINCKGLVPCYDTATDVLKFYWDDLSNGSDGPEVVVPTGDMQSYTGLVIGVISH